MFLCIYCCKLKQESEKTLEHVIPLSLGGACTPELFKIRRVCKACNNNLGLFVDASFEKSWFIASWIQQSAMACFDPKKPTSLPLMYLGTSEFKPPHMLDDEICDAYVGPLGESIYLIRPIDERFYWYAGGNPRTYKDRYARAYFIFTQRSTKNPDLTILTVKDAFKNKKVKKISCSQIFGIDLEIMNLSRPDTVDNDVVNYLWEHKNKGPEKNLISLNLEFDARFLAKLARGVGFCLFGEKVLSGSYPDAVTKAIWYKSGDQTTFMGKSIFSSVKDKDLTTFLGIDNAITLTINHIDDAISINLNLGRQHNATIKCMTSDNLNKADILKIGSGIILIIFPHLLKSLTLSFHEFIVHKQSVPNIVLKEIEDAIKYNESYFQNL